MVIEAGALAPDFTLSDQHGQEHSLAELLEDGPIALVFFPLAFSGICTGELCELRDNLAVFADAKVRVVGISVDSVHALRVWAEQEGYTLPILSDFWPHGEVAQAYGAFFEPKGFATRATVLIATDRRVVASFETSPGQPRDFAAYRAALDTL